MALKNVRVIEMAGLAPAPFCGMVLRDFGASIIRVDKPQTAANDDRLARGKRSIALDLKQEQGRSVVRKLCRDSDVLIEPYRRGVMERLNLGPEVLMKENPRLIYARLTGYGQNGSFADRAGHDINYVALSGVLSMIGRKGEKPIAPINLLADFAGGGLMCAFGICLALLERTKSGIGQVIDASMVEGAAYVSSWLWRSQDHIIWGQPRGSNVLDTGAHFYDTYKTKDDKYVAVGALEPQFYEALLKGLQQNITDLPQFEFDSGRQKLTAIFAMKTRDEWMRVFEGSDACVTPVLELNEAPSHQHNRERGTFIKSENGNYEPRPAPLLERTPAEPCSGSPKIGQHSEEILKELGYNDEEVARLLEDGVVQSAKTMSKL